MVYLELFLFLSTAFFILQKLKSSSYFLSSKSWFLLVVRLCVSAIKGEARSLHLEVVFFMG